MHAFQITTLFFIFATMNTICSLTQYAIHALKDTYSENETRCICSLIFMDVLQYTNIDIHIKKHDTLDESFANKFYEIITLLKTNRPIQYILGETEFAELRFGLNDDTLIPRPETEELIHWMEEKATPNAHILDIGTGSGCIAITLAHRIPGAVVTAVDISENAVKQARENAQRNNVNVEIQVRDILNDDQYEWHTYDIIVSNPPYVRECEKAEMHPRVLDYEPHRALFVPDTDPLLFYRHIARFALRQLHPGGILFFEINEAFGGETVEMLSEMGYTDVILKKDIHEKVRMCKAEKAWTVKKH